MNLIELVDEKFKAQSKYTHEIILDKGMRYCFRLGDAVLMMYWDDVLSSDNPTRETQHTEECVRNQSIICPECGELVLVEQQEWHDYTEYNAFCKNCHWSSDDNRKPISEWLDKNDYYYTCGCPSVEVPPSAPMLSRHIYNTLLNNNEEVESITVGVGQ